MSGAAARLRKLEREEARRRAAEAKGAVKLNFIFGGGPEEAAARAAGEKIVAFDYTQGNGEDRP